MERGHPSARYFTWWKCWFLRWCATEALWKVMGGFDPQAEDLWLEIMLVVELDRKSAMDLILLAQSGAVGRASASKIMWNLMTDWALDRDHPNLSKRVTLAVRRARERFDMPKTGIPAMACDGPGRSSRLSLMT